MQEVLHSRAGRATDSCTLYPQLSAHCLELAKAIFWNDCCWKILFCWHLKGRKDHPTSVGRYPTAEFRQSTLFLTISFYPSIVLPICIGLDGKSFLNVTVVLCTGNYSDSTVLQGNILTLWKLNFLLIFEIHKGKILVWSFHGFTIDQVQNSVPQYVVCATGFSHLI